jgi:RNA polymerase sigma-70 factor, ECF subfamily
VSAAVTFNTSINPESFYPHVLRRGYAEGTAMKNKEPKANPANRGSAGVDICSKPEPDAEKRTAANSVKEQEMLGDIVADLSLSLSKDSGIPEDKERSKEGESLSGDLQKQVLALYDEYRPRLLRYMRSMHLGRDAAEEVIQETFMRLTVELLKGTDIENVRGWIVRVAHNLAVDWLKKQREPVIIDESLAFAIENRADSALSPEEEYSKKEQLKKMTIALSNLKPLHRQCFQMRAQGFRYKDIGLALGISEQRAAFIVKQAAVRLAAICE